MNLLDSTIAFVISIIITVWALRDVRRAQRLKLHGSRAHGIVVGEQFRSGDPGLYHALILFSTRDGKSVEVVSPTGQENPSAILGEEVNILYEAKKPQNFLLNDYWTEEKNSTYSVLIFIACFWMLFFIGSIFAE